MLFRSGSGFVNGYVYKCVSDGGDPAMYSWVIADTSKHGLVKVGESETSDGVKTYSELLNPLWNSVGGLDNKYLLSEELSDQNRYYYCRYHKIGSDIAFVLPMRYANDDISSINVTIKQSGSSVCTINIATNTSVIQIQDVSSNVMPANRKYVLYKLV